MAIVLGLMGGSEAEASPGAGSESIACGSCHPLIFEEWRASGLARAETGPLPPLAIPAPKNRACNSCHGSGTTASGEASPAIDAASGGVQCMDCHGLESAVEQDGRFVAQVAPAGVVMAGLRVDEGTGAMESKAHVIRRSADFGSSEGCARCHASAGPARVPAVATYAEWKRSVRDENREPCIACHMPERAGLASVSVDQESVTGTHRSHRFDGGGPGSPLLAHAAEIRDLSVSDDNLLTVWLRTLRPRHSFPTRSHHGRGLRLTIRVFTEGPTLGIERVFAWSPDADDRFGAPLRSGGDRRERFQLPRPLQVRRIEAELDYGVMIEREDAVNIIEPTRVASFERDLSPPDAAR